jgi:hypothetical protein
MQDAMLGLTFWEGYVVDSCSEAPDHSLLIRLIEAPQGEARCSRCHQVCVLVHERRRRKVRDRDLFDRRVVLDVPNQFCTPIPVPTVSSTAIPPLTWSKFNADRWSKLRAD